MIRKANKNDYVELAWLLKEYMVDYHRKKILKGIQHKFMEYKNIDKAISDFSRQYCTARQRDKFTFVYEKDRKLIGFIFGEVQRDKEKSIPTVGFIEDWFVTEGFRNQKIGKQLWGKAMEFFELKKVEVVKLEAFSQNKQILKMYKKMGFEPLYTTLIKRI